MKTEPTLFNMHGNSMYPVLCDNDQGFVKTVNVSTLRKGDIVVFAQNGKFLAHRLVGIRQDQKGIVFTAKGDNNRFSDKPFGKDALKGVITTYFRDGKPRNLNSFYQRLYRFNSLNLPDAAFFCRRIRFRITTRFRHGKSRVQSFCKNFRRILSTSEKVFFWNAVLAFLQGIVPFLLIVCIKVLVDLLTNPSLRQQGALGQQEWWWLLLTALLFLSGGALTTIGNFCTDKLNDRISRHTFKLLHDKHSRLCLSDYEQSGQQDAMHRAAQEAGFRPVKMASETLSLIRSGASLAVMFLLFLQLRWYLVLILLAAVLPGAWIRLRYAGHRYRLKQAQNLRERRMFYFSRILTGEAFAKELRLFRFANRFSDRFETMEKELYTEKQKLLRSETKADLFTQLFAVVLIFTSLVLVITMMFSGHLSIGSVVLFLFVFQRGYSVLGETFRSVTRLTEDNVFLNDFIRFLDMPESDENGSGKQPEVLRNAIRVEHVCFRYADSNREALEDISLTVPAGKTIAIVGPNGSGKSTLMKLLCGFYPPSDGCIYYDDDPLQDLDKESLRGRITAVFQDYALYNLSASENIALGDIRRTFDPERVRIAAENADIANILEHLPDGYETLLGHLFNSGEDLSIGQWQKIAIARAFYRDAPLLFLDEPSSALDAVSERQILETLRKLGRDKTVVLISHRLSSVQWADRIFVLDRGKLVEEGNHESLMALKGVYYSLYQANQTFTEKTNG
jgi:ATP-binding cassette, subfamily B, bacterial